MLKFWAISKVIGDGTPRTNPYRPSLSDDFPALEWRDILFAQPPYVPAVAISRAVADEAAALAVHQAVRSLVLAAMVWDENAGAWGDYIRNSVNWGYDAPFTESRFNDVRDGLVALGTDAQTIDDWHTNHPNATPREFYTALKVFLRSQ